MEMQNNFLINMCQSGVACFLLTVLLNRSGSSILVECTFGYAWKNLNHRIRAVLLIHVRVLDDVRSISEETAAQKFVYHYDIDDLQNIKGLHNNVNT
jgi:hypothetical protein